MVLLAAVLVFWPVVTFDFTGYDDADNVTVNPNMNPVTGAAVVRYWTGPYLELYIPLAYTAWSGLAVLAREKTADGRVALDPSVFHGANLVLHLVASGVVYALVRKLVRHRAGGDSRAADWAACAGAALFAVHPLQVEPVAWVSGLRDVLAGALGVVALWFYVAFATSGGGRRAWFYVGGLLAFVLSMLSKPSTMSLPLAAAAIDLLLVRRPARSVAVAVAPWLAAGAAMAVVTRMVQPAAQLPPTPVWSRPLVALDTLSVYAAKLVLPWELGIDYGRTPTWLLARADLYWTWAPAAVVLALAVGWWRRWPVFACGVAVFVAMVLPVLGLVPFQFQWHSTMADRYAYVALVGVSIGVAFLVGRWPGRVTAVIVAVVVAALAVRAHVQVWTWKDSEALFAHALKVNPKGLAGNNWWAVYEARQGRVDRALAHFRAALDEHPEDPITNFNLGELLLAVGEPGAAVEPLQVALATGRGEAITYLRLSQARRGTGDVLGAINAARQGAARHPESAELQEVLGRLLMEIGDLAGAHAAFSAALEANPRFGPARAGLAEVEFRLKAVRSPAGR